MMRLGDIYRGLTGTVRDPFPTDTAGLPEAAGTETVELRDGGRLALRAAPVRKRLGAAAVRMLAAGRTSGRAGRVAQARTGRRG